MRRAVCFAVAISLLLSGCASTWRDSAVTAANVVITVANEAGENLLQRYCADSMHAINRDGHFVRDTSGVSQCEESGARAGTAATADERRALDQLRAKWKPVRDAEAVLEAAYVQVRKAFDNAASMGAQAFVDTLWHLAALYGAVCTAARDVGINLPPLVTP